MTSVDSFFKIQSHKCFYRTAGVCVCHVAGMVCAFNFSLVAMGEPFITLEESTGSRPPPGFQSWLMWVCSIRSPLGVCQYQFSTHLLVFFCAHR